jgi:membrane protease YdiL (CAAX protease family)
MSLRYFHVLFIIVCVALAALVGGWGLRRYLVAGSGADLGLALVFFVMGFVLILYGLRFFNKLKELESR